MKKITFYTIAALFLLSYTPSFGKTELKSTAITNNSAHVRSSTEANSYLARLDEIKAMDKSTLSPRQKKSLRNEVKAIKQRLQTLDGGIYISVGAIIIILLLIIILF